MKLEVEAAVGLIKRIVSRNNSLSKGQVKIFCDHLLQLLMQKFDGHWHDVDPVKGNGYRCLRINNQDPAEPSLLAACRLSGLQYKDLRLPRELTLWVDPGEVSCRIGEMRPQHFLVAKVSKDGLKYLENRIRDIDIDDAERRHMELVRRTKSDLFTITSSASSALADAARAKAAAGLTERRALVAASSVSADFMSNSTAADAVDCSGFGSVDDASAMTFLSMGGASMAGFDNMDRFYGPLSSPPAASKHQQPLLNPLHQFANGFLPSWNGILEHNNHQLNGFYADAQQHNAYAGKPVANNVATNNVTNMRGRANSYRNAAAAATAAVGYGSARQHNSLSSGSPISNSNSNLSTSSNTTPPPNSQAALNSRFSPPSISSYQQSHTHEYMKRQQNSSGSVMSHPISSYANMPPTSVNTPVNASSNQHYAAQQPQHYNSFQRQPSAQQLQNHVGMFTQSPAAAAFFPTSMASGPGMPPHNQHLMMGSPAHGPNYHNYQNNIMPNQHNNNRHAYGMGGHNHHQAAALMAQRSTALVSSD